MNLGDVFAALATLIGLGIAAPGLWLAWALIFPGTVQRAKTRLQRTPWLCLWLGGVLFVFFFPVALILIGIKSRSGTILRLDDNFHLARRRERR